MNDAVKHTTGTLASAAGFVFSLKAATEWAQFACAVFGTIAAICTIYSWLVNRNKNKKKL